MFKTITVMSIKDGVDPEDFWKYHTEVHALDALEIGGPGLKRYVVNRWVQPMGGDVKKFFAMVEMWWENKEASDAYTQKGKTYITASGKNPSEDYEAHGGVFEYKIQVEEKQIK